MTREEWKINHSENMKVYEGNWVKARKYFPLCKLGKKVVLHHTIFNCINYEEWNVKELVPMFTWCHCRLHHPPGRIGPHKGRKHSEESKKKISDRNKGHIVSEATREKIGNANKGKLYPCRAPLSEEACKKISLANKGKKPPNFGVPMSEGQKRKISAANKGKNHSQERKMRISESLKGHKQSEETKRKRRMSLKGRLSPSLGKHWYHKWSNEGWLELMANEQPEGYSKGRKPNFKKNGGVAC